MCGSMPMGCVAIQQTIGFNHSIDREREKGLIKAGLPIVEVVL